MSDIDAMIRAGMNGGPPQPLAPTVVTLPDLQIIALIASQLYEPVESNAAPEAVTRACSIFAEAVVQLNGGALKRAVEAAKLRANVG